MAFRLIFSEEALRELRKLDNADAKRIVGRLKEASGNPIHYFERLSGREEYKLRIGDYRAIANIVHENSSILVRSIGHRKNIYEKK